MVRDISEMTFSTSGVMLSKILGKISWVAIKPEAEEEVKKLNYILEKYNVITRDVNYQPKNTEVL